MNWKLQKITHQHSTNEHNFIRNYFFFFLANSLYNKSSFKSSNHIQKVNTKALYHQVENVHIFIPYTIVLWVDSNESSHSTKNHKIFSFFFCLMCFYRSNICKRKKKITSHTRWERKLEIWWIARVIYSDIRNSSSSFLQSN